MVLSNETKEKMSNSRKQYYINKNKYTYEN